MTKPRRPTFPTYLEKPRCSCGAKRRPVCHAPALGDYECGSFWFDDGWLFTQEHVTAVTARLKSAVRKLLAFHYDEEWTPESLRAYNRVRKMVEDKTKKEEANGK